MVEKSTVKLSAHPVAAAEGWVPAFAGMTTGVSGGIEKMPSCVKPTEACARRLQPVRRLSIPPAAINEIDQRLSGFECNSGAHVHFKSPVEVLTVSNFGHAGHSSKPRSLA